MQKRTVTLNGIEVYPFLSAEELLDFIEEQKKILVAVNAEKILHATPALRQIINENIGYCDGNGAVMALKKRGHKQTVKIPGCELWLKIIGRWQETKTFYLVGGKQDVIEATVNRLKKEFPGIRILNYRNGYIRTNEEKKALLDDLAARKPDVVYVAMGSPKQELLMNEMKQRHPAIYQGLGGSFDVYTGNVKRAPKWWLKHNLEFAYRLWKQPTRIKRYMHLVRFFALLELGKL